ncbi:hypothetical protein VNDN067_09970 [Mycobacterium tuberculosis]|nr:hypothetical protein VNDN049_09970 [Mycobacterium tuberculosis]BCR48166.1 hypothetical protein VNDN059_10000 [Mycobacterium tuberculosis]BCR52207.1 hypothetical protein VNDN067_09970 [Mycobacterium tuberculosis]BCR56262.1 hypothetical protein VNDN068_10010 [Mycobacterium tuberculosis]BCR60298.1 hypothetical protein VNDN101_10000 [Mycobacterium tuberculosis]
MLDPILLARGQRMPPPLDLLRVAVRRRHLRHCGWRMAELGIDLLARQVPGGASNRRGQILIGGLGVGQQTFDALRIAVLRMAC